VSVRTASELDDDGAPVMRWSAIVGEESAPADDGATDREHDSRGAALCWALAPLVLLGITMALTLPASQKDLFVAIIAGGVAWIAVGVSLCVVACWRGPIVKTLLTWNGAFLIGVFGVYVVLHVPKEWSLPIAVHFAWGKHRASCLEAGESVFAIPGDADSRWSGAFVRRRGTNADGSARLLVDGIVIDAPRGSHRHRAGSERIVDDTWTCHADGEWWYLCRPR
jgi:hypothetical protein